MGATLTIFAEENPNLSKDACFLGWILVFLK